MHRHVFKPSFIPPFFVRFLTMPCLAVSWPLLLADAVVSTILYQCISCRFGIVQSVTREAFFFVSPSHVTVVQKKFQWRLKFNIVWVELLLIQSFFEQIKHDSFGPILKNREMQARGIKGCAFSIHFSIVHTYFVFQSSHSRAV